MLCSRSSPNLVTAAVTFNVDFSNFQNSLVQSHNIVFNFFNFRGEGSQSKCNWLLPTWVYHQPASKLYIHQESQQIYKTFKVIFNSRRILTFQLISNQRLDDPLQFHENHFSVFEEPSGFTPASVLDRYSYLIKYKNDKNACLDLVYRLSKYCTYEIMTALSQIHNMSFDLQDVSRQRHSGDLYEFFTGQFGPGSSNTTFSWRNIALIRYLRQIKFGFVGTKGLMYCDITPVRESNAHLALPLWGLKFGFPRLI